MRIGLYLSRYPSSGTSRVVSEDPKMQITFVNASPRCRLVTSPLRSQLDVLRRQIDLSPKLGGLRQTRCLEKETTELPSTAKSGDPQWIELH
jgi:hypothetical protein